MGYLSRTKQQPEPLPTAKQISLYRNLFQGRADVYAKQWEDTKTGRVGYSPSYRPDWTSGGPRTPQIKGYQRSKRALLPVSDQVIQDHLTGTQTMGLYPLLEDHCCHLLVVDFDKDHWQNDARDFVTSCDSLAIHAYLEVSRSGNGAHVWIFSRHRSQPRKPDIWE